MIITKKECPKAIPYGTTFEASFLLLNHNTIFQRNDAFSLPKVSEKSMNDNNNINNTGNNADLTDRRLKHSQSSTNMANRTLSIFPKNSFYANKYFN